MTGFPFRQITVIEIEVTYEYTVIESSPVDICAPASNQGTAAPAAQFIDVSAYHAYGFSMQRAKTAAQRIQDSDLELLAGIGIQSLKVSSMPEFRNLFHLTHDALLERCDLF
jgi:hypothetical protein